MQVWKPWQKICCLPVLQDVCDVDGRRKERQTLLLTFLNQFIPLNVGVQLVCFVRHHIHV